MESLISIYSNHSDAVEAIKLLKANNFDTKRISLLSPAHSDEAAQNVQNANTAVTGVGLGAVAGTTLGVLAGIGVVAVPGLGFLVGAGALAGAVAGFDFGVIGGSLLSALAIGGLKEDLEERYQKELESGRSLVVLQGEENDLERAKDLLQNETGPLGLELH